MPAIARMARSDNSSPESAEAQRHIRARSSHHPCLKFPAISSPVSPPIVGFPHL
ncbi:hypothetical protein QO207_00985 [Pseudomonas sp. CAN2814]|uniref:hypothetical protein n=1 Tax=Pseudomonas sp. CAN1 TaxID=3046726 RepID=UPI002648C8CF|nr:hypothetical protein [Pseudomonas sp. CAN1]MDN6855143.1 hypothetical protein [Pseudomonas sp. CAN1]